MNGTWRVTLGYGVRDAQGGINAHTQTLIIDHCASADRAAERARAWLLRMQIAKYDITHYSVLDVARVGAA